MVRVFALQRLVITSSPQPVKPHNPRKQKISGSEPKKYIRTFKKFIIERKWFVEGR
jgi:hypothetical protein